MDSHSHELYQCGMFMGMTPKERLEKMKGRICRTCLKPGGLCLTKDKRCSTKVPKGLVCDGCAQYTQGRKLFPHNILYCTSSRPEHICPPKSEFYQTMQDYFGGKVAGKITPETVCYKVFLCSWKGELSPTRYTGESEPSCSMMGFAESPATAYLTQWVMVESTPW